MSARQMVIPKNDRDLHTHTQRHTTVRLIRGPLARACVRVCVCVCLPVVVGEAGSPVGGPEECLQSTGQVHEEVAHQEEPGGRETQGQTQRERERERERATHTHTDRQRGKRKREKRKKRERAMETENLY